MVPSGLLIWVATRTAHARTELRIGRIASLTTPGSGRRRSQITPRHANRGLFRGAAADRRPTVLYDANRACTDRSRRAVATRTLLRRGIIWRLSGLLCTRSQLCRSGFGSVGPSGGEHVSRSFLVRGADHLVGPGDLYRRSPRCEPAPWVYAQG